MPRVGWPFLADCLIPSPSAVEQEQISKFIAGEIAKIDALIEEQQRLIKLLTEKRKAIISHAVTKGLNNEAPMRDSGMSSCNEVPVHWSLVPLKRVLEFVTSGSRGWAEHYAVDGDLFLRIANLTRDSIEVDLSNVQRVKVPSGAEGERTKVMPGDLLFSITALLGSVAVIPDDIQGAYVSQHVALARLNKNRVLPAWAAYVAISKVGSMYFDLRAYGGTKVQLGLDDVADMPMLVPPLTEQQAIVIWLANLLKTFDQLKRCSDKAVALLQERRTALTSAAVTGKIDVRNYSPTPVHEPA